MKPKLLISHEGSSSSFETTRLDRAKLYGSKRRIAVDTAGRECRVAALTRDGMCVLPAGGVARLYLDESGDVVGRGDLRVVGGEAEPTGTAEPQANTQAELGPESCPQEILDCDFSRAWALDPIFLSPRLDVSVSSGEIHRVRLPASFARGASEGFLLQGPSCLLLLAGEQIGFEPLGREEIDLTSEENDEMATLDGADGLGFDTL